VPVRKIPPNSFVPTYFFSSRKNGRLMGCQSPTEYDYYQTLEFDDDVESYEEQPVEIIELVNGRQTPFYPDTLLTFKPHIRKRPQLVEVKTLRELSDPKKADRVKRQLSVYRKYARNNRYGFKVVRDIDIGEEYLYNLKFLYKYLDPPDHFSKYHKTILEIVSTSSKVMVSDILDAIAQDRPERARILPTIWHLVGTKLLWIDLNKKITNNSLLEVSK
jgi:hypothetical protein